MSVETPPGVPAALRVRQAGRTRYVVAGLVVLGALGFLFLRLGDATVYFRTADEAAKQRTSLGERRFRLEGVVDGRPRKSGNDVTFVVSANGVTVPVLHHGEQPALFQPNIPVVLEGHFVKGSETFLSDKILVKHSESYRAEHPGRTKAYDGKG